MEKIYAAIDLKSFYASAECVDRGLDPLNTNLIVADKSRTDKTIVLAVTPTLKARGIGSRPRLYQVIQKVKDINKLRRLNAKNHTFAGSSYIDSELNNCKELALDYIIAPPRMDYYKKVSTKAYSVYLKYFSPDDIHVYSVDEVFIDITPYIKLYKTTARKLLIKVIRDVLRETGITATCGVGTNLFLAKAAMDIVAKKTQPDKYGVRMAYLDEMLFRKTMWSHKPLIDFWKIGRGTATKLEKHGMFTLGDIALCSTENEDILYDLFGIDAELLIDHAWGWESCEISHIKKYKPKINSLSVGQVLKEPYTYEKARIIIREMANELSLDMVKKKTATNKLTVTIGYDTENINGNYKGKTVTDIYGRKIPPHSHGTFGLNKYTNSEKLIANGVVGLFDDISEKALTVRRINITADNITLEKEIHKKEPSFSQISFFTDFSFEESEKKLEEKERKKSLAIIEIKSKYGKNALIRGIDLSDGATAIERNTQVGGHKA